jgi:serine/threonine protein kinase
VRAEGTEKVLDFGLAKLASSDVRGDREAGVPLTQSLTLTSPALITGVGVIVGTAAYMALEQAKGRPADQRSDIWAVGCVVYGMLTGKRPFDGEDIIDTLANMLKIDADWSALSSEIPTAIRILLQSCLTSADHFAHSCV